MKLILLAKLKKLMRFCTGKKRLLYHFVRQEELLEFMDYHKVAKLLCVIVFGGFVSDFGETVVNFDLLRDSSYNYNVYFFQILSCLQLLYCRIFKFLNFLSDFVPGIYVMPMCFVNSYYTAINSYHSDTITIF
ncbi:hypothetical protein Dimus_020085 [Dionaea muscipula]